MKRIFLFLFLLLIPLSSALTVSDTTFSTSETNFTVHVDTVTLSSFNITNQSIILNGITSRGSNFTNINSTLSAVVNFINLSIGLNVVDVNTSTNLFTSASGSQDFNATILPLEVVLVGDAFTPEPTEGQLSCSAMVAQFGLFPALAGLLGTIILLAAVIFVLVEGFKTVRTEGVNLHVVFRGLLIVVMIAILIIVAIVILSSLCILF